MKQLKLFKGNILENQVLNEIAKAMELSISDVSEIENYINYISVVSLENVIFSDGEDITVMGIIEDKNSPSPEA